MSAAKCVSEGAEDAIRVADMPAAPGCCVSAQRCALADACFSTVATGPACHEQGCCTAPLNHLCFSPVCRAHSESSCGCCRFDLGTKPPQANGVKVYRNERSTDQVQFSMLGPLIVGVMAVDGAPSFLHSVFVVWGARWWENGDQSGYGPTEAPQHSVVCLHIIEGQGLCCL